MRPLFIYIIRCDPAKPMRKKGKSEKSKEIIVLEYAFLLEKRQKYSCFSLEKRQKSPFFVLEKRKCFLQIPILLSNLADTGKKYYICT